jgi:alkanesulfonate monooxygenase
VTFAGQHFAVDGAQVLPTPVQRPHPPIILGGQGRPRGLALAAAHADEYNYLALSPADVEERQSVVRAACERVGRDPVSLALSVTVAVTVGDQAADRERRVAAARAETGTQLDERHSSWIVGDGAALREKVVAYERAGINRIILQDFIPQDTAMLTEMATMLGLSPQ